MLKLCEVFAKDNFITFNTKKTVCIKYGEVVKPTEKVFFSGQLLAWHKEVRHLGNYFNCKMDNSIDGSRKCSSFIGYFNKLYSNFGHLQCDVISMLFKSYCCSFYGSFLWKYQSDGFIKCCTAWNKAVRKIHSLPFRAHRWILGPMLNQYHISYQLYRRDIKMIYQMKVCTNQIVKQCLSVSIHDSNTLIGYKLAFYRSRFALLLNDIDLIECLRRAVPFPLTVDQTATVDCLHNMCLENSFYYDVDGFTKDEIQFIIDYIATM